MGGEMLYIKYCVHIKMLRWMLEIYRISMFILLQIDIEYFIL